MNVRSILALVAFAFCTGASAQGVFKCKDKAGKISYVQQECNELGLLPGGDMKETNIAPAQKPVPLAPAPQRAQQKPASIAATPKEEEVADPANPNRRCFKTAKGTRCNDVPSGNPEQKIEQK